MNELLRHHGRKWLRACKVADVVEDEGRQVHTVPPIAVFMVEGEYYSIDDTCTHETYSLAEGWVDGLVVECTLHMAKFDLCTGAAMSPPASIALQTHPVEARDDGIYVAIPDAYFVKQSAETFLVRDAENASLVKES